MLHNLLSIFHFRAKSAKTFLTLSGSPKYSGGFSKGKGIKIIGSSNYGYPLSGGFGSSFGGSFGDSFGDSNVMVLDSNNVFDATGGSNIASASNVVRLISGGPQQLFRKPQRYIITNGGRKPRNSENLHWPLEPIRQLEDKPIGRPKKPIPVGEKFRLP